MAGQIFREKSLDRISSPEELNQYVKVASPSIWFTLAAVIVFLAGICLWGVVGEIETKAPCAVVSKAEGTVGYVSEESVNALRSEGKITIDGNSYIITDIATEPVKLDAMNDGYMISILGKESDAWVYSFRVEGNISQGVYRATVITDRVHPMSFVIN